MSGHVPSCPLFSFLSRLAGPAGGCRSSGWALALLARLSLALVGGLVVSFVSLSEGAVPRTAFSAGIPLFSSGTSVPCTRSPESAGHFVKNSVMGQMVGSRRSPGATILGGEHEYLTCQPSLFVPPTGPVHCDASCCGQCTRWLVQNFLTGLCSGSSVPFIRSHASAGHRVVCVVTGQMVGDRRFPGATILGASCSTTSANHPVSVPPTGPELPERFLLFWDFGSLYQRRCGVISYALSRQPYCSSIAAAISALCRGTSQQNITFRCFCNSRRCGVLVSSCCGSGIFSCSTLRRLSGHYPLPRRCGDVFVLSLVHRFL